MTKRVRKDVYEERLAVYDREQYMFTNVAESLVGFSTVALYGLNEKEVPRPVGSGVLFRCGSKLFILTAAHVADEFKGKPAFISRGEGFFPIHGAYHLSSVPESGNRDDDLLDFAVLRIDGEAAEVFMDNAISVEHVFTPPPEFFCWRGFALVGFPARNFRITNGSFSGRGSILQTAQLLSSRYAGLSLDPQAHIALEWFNTTFSPQGVVRSRSLAGMSGGGIWLVPEMMHEDFRGSVAFSQPKLFGIFTAHKKGHSALIGTRINLHLRKIIQEYPDLPLYRRFGLYEAGRVINFLE